MGERTATRGLILRYVIARLGQAVLVLWAAYTLSFLVLYALPSDPVALLAGGDATDISPAQLDELRQRYGLDQPLWVQYLLHLGGILSGDLGNSISTGRPVADVIAEAIPPTAQLAGAALVVAVLLGAGIALAATFTRSPRLSSFLLGLPPLGVAMPSFWLGLVLIQALSFQLPLFPALGDKGVASLVLPAITLAVPTSAAIAQLLAKSLATTLDEPYIDTAWAKGVGRVRVHLAHALRNAALPALTVTGLVVGQLLSGTVVTETVFSRPGIGRVTAQAVQQQDVPVVQGVVLFAAAVFVVTTLAVDLIYPLLDPRIVLSGSTPRRPRRRATDAVLVAASSADASSADADRAAPLETVVK